MVWFFPRWALVATLTGMILGGHPQTASGQILDTPQSPQEDPTAASTVGLGAVVAGPGTGLEEAISGTEYRLGPGDVLALSIWGPAPTTAQLPVTLEGKLLIPEVGELSVDGLLLDEAKKRVRARVLRSFHNVDVSVTLVGLRRFQVHVLGRVANPGTYLATAVDRVSSAVTWSGGFTERAGQRSVQVTNRGELRAQADLFSFFQRGDRTGNPRLVDGDVIYVPYTRDRFIVTGAVHRTGPLELVPGDRFSDALRLAGGFTAESFADTVEVARYNKPNREPFRFFVVDGGGLAAADPREADLLPVSGGTFSPLPVDLPSSQRPVYADFNLQPDDIVFVRRVPEYRRQRLVEVQGEVEFPGSYPLTEGQTRLSDVITWAGGLTEDAFLIEARLVRRQAQGQEDKEFERLQKVPVADMRESEYAYFKMKSRENPGQMVVDFRRALAEPGTEADPLLVRGDLVVVPTRKDFVSVLGMVGFPGNVTYRPGLNAKQYIERAGGYADEADRGDARVIRAEGGEWVKLGEAKELSPGDVVFVPEKPERSFWRIFRDALTVTTQIVTVYLVVDRAVGP